MPRAMKKYALAPDGRVVYRDTGRVARGNLTLKASSNGQIRVYRNGRLDGYVGKPTKRVQNDINRRAKQRVKRAENAQRKQFIGDTMDVSDLPTWRDMVDQARVWRRDEVEGNRPIRTHDRMIRRYNFAEMLQKAVDSGVITEDEATDRWLDFDEEMRNGDRESQKQQWDDIKQYFKDMGFEYEEGKFKTQITGKISYLK